MTRKAPIDSRDDFPALLASKGLAGGPCVEVGTHRGDYARAFLRRRPEGVLYCVDHWAVPPGYEGQARSLLALGGAYGDREADLESCKLALAPFAGRAVLLREASADAARRFAPRSLDFCYLDGDHERPGIDDDLRLWWPKVVPGGLLAGHDYHMPGYADDVSWSRFIRPAVDEFAARHGLDVLVVEEPGGLPHSFYLEKPS